MSTQRIHSEENCYLLGKKNVTAIVGFTLFFLRCVRFTEKENSKAENLFVFSLAPWTGQTAL